jgi:uncharacterized NAD-dependent epimerase/dehydratase family protein
MSEPMLNFAPFPLAGRRALLLADGEFSVFGAKTAVCYLRYRTDDVVAVLDHTKSGKTVEDVVGFGGDIPIVASIDEAANPEVAIVGVAPQGGRLTTTLRRQIVDCLDRGLDVASGLHDFIEDDRDINAASEKTRAHIWDVRRVPSHQVVGTGRGCTSGAHTVLVVGSDCNVGKMTATVEIYNEVAGRGVRASWAATGQTGMMLRGRGIAVDRVISDFVSGAAEALVNFEGKDSDLVVVEGQGALLHPGYAGVTLGLLYGVMPDAIVMVHAATRDRVGDTGPPMPPLPSVIASYETAMAPFKPAQVVAVALNTAGLADAEARDMMAETRAQTQLPVADPVRDGAAAIVDAIAEHLHL